MNLRSVACRRVALAGVVAAAAATSALAHPLGDNSITHISVLRPYRDRVELEFFIDIAEIPCMGALLEMDTDQDGEESTAEQKTWLAQRVERHRSRLALTADDKPLEIRIAADTPAPDGSRSPPYVMIKDIGNLPGLWTLKIFARYVAPLPAGGPDTVRITYQDATYPEVTGLKRVLLESSGEVRIDARDVKFIDEDDPFAYEMYDPTNMPQERTAAITVTKLTAATTQPITTSRAAATGPSMGGRAIEDLPDPPSETAQARRDADSIIDQVGAGLTPMLFAIVSLTCFGYGAWHALMPGHAKTVVAAYLISQHGRWPHAVVLALTVTATHTFIVFVMMAVISLAGGEKGAALQLWLGAVSGAIILIMGLWLGFRAATGRLDHHHHHHDENTPWYKKLFTHSHPDVPGHHHHHDHEHGHSHAHHHHTHEQAGDDQRRITAKQIIVLGVSGGIVPCPTATFLGLGLINYDPWLAYYLVIMFSLGLALTLMIVGMAALLSNRFAHRVMHDAAEHGTPNRWMTRILPGLSSIAVVTIGGIMVTHYAYMLGTGRALVDWLG
jgi:ABC-type nickel/cobalt efflux system permease component RcnA